MKVAIVGLGSIGRRHARLLHELYPDMEIVTVRSGLGAECAEDQLAKRRVSNISAALDVGVDAAIISGPATTHAHAIIDCLMAGVPVLAEKPLTADSPAAELIVARRQDCQNVYRKSLVGYVLRHHPGFQRLKQAINQQIFGTAREVTAVATSFLPDWRPDRDFRDTVSAQQSLGGGVMRELSHEIDYVNALLGPISNVFAFINPYGVLAIDCEEQVMIGLQSVAGALISVHLDFAVKTRQRVIDITFTTGRAIWNIDAEVVSGWNENEKIFNDPVSLPRDELYKTQLRHFIACIRGQEMPVCTLDEGAQVVRIIAAIEASTISGQKVNLS